MKVPLTIVDHLRRAELVYGNRTAITDEPDQPATSWGSLTYNQVAQRARAQAAGLDALRLGIPVVTTAPCAASPLATSLEAIETPYLHGDRIRLFSTLAWGQFTPDEMRSGLAWQVLNGQA